MFQVQYTILPDEVAYAKFACNPVRCKGACCVAGDAGAPLSEDEVSILHSVYETIKYRLRQESVNTVEKYGVTEGKKKEPRVRCNKNGACVFAVFNPKGVASCAIQKAHQDGLINWEKPISCHLFPLRIKEYGELEYASYRYIEPLCQTACAFGCEKEVFLSEFLQPALVRYYGKTWYNEFQQQCKLIRKKRRMKL